MIEIKYKNRTFKIIETIQPNETPAIKKLYPDILYHFIAEGKKGSLLSGFMRKDKTYRIF